MSPLLSGIIRLISRIAVVLPDPDGPTSTHTSPAGTLRLRSVIAGSRCPGYRLETLRSSSVAGPPAAGPVGSEVGNDDGPSDWAVFADDKVQARAG